MHVVEQLQVGILNQQAAVDALEVQAVQRLGRPFAAGQQAHVLLRADRFDGLGGNGRGDDHLNELAIADGLRGLAVEFAVEGDDAAEGGFRIGAVGAVVGFEQVVAEGHAAGIGMLDDHAGRAFIELLDAFQRGIGVGDVVERQFLALQLVRGGDARFLDVLFHVEGRVLMRVLAVTHALLAAVLQVDGVGEGFFLAALVDRAQVVGDGAVVLRGVLEGLDRELEAGGVGNLVVALAHLLDDLAVVRRVDHDDHVFVVLGCSTNHGRAADIDVLDGVFQGAVWVGDGLLEGVEVDRDQVDAADAVLVHHAVVGTATTENAAVNLRVQGLHAAVHHFRKAGVVGDFHHLDVGLAQQLGGAAGGQDLNAGLRQVAGEFDHAGFVGNADEGSGDGGHRLTCNDKRALAGALWVQDKKFSRYCTAPASCAGWRG